MSPEHWISYLQCCDKNNHCIHIKLLIEHTHTVEDPAQLSVCRGALLQYMAQWPCSSYLVLPRRLPWARMGPTMCCCYCRHVLNAREAGSEEGREARCSTCRLAHGNNRVVVFPVSLRWSHCIRLQVKCVSAPIKFNSTIKPVNMSQPLEQSG